MSDVIATLVAYTITALVLWRRTRKSEDVYVRDQWRKPLAPLARLLALFIVLHGLFVLCNFPTAAGFLLLSISWIIAMLDWTGISLLLTTAFAYAFYEWVFWFPKSRQAILNRSISSDLPPREHLLGASGVVASDLRPTGLVIIDGTEHAARSDLKSIPAGEPIVVESVGDFELLVVPSPN